jgi:uncharacterized protein YhaN
MHIERIDIDRFGGLQRVLIDSIVPGVQVFHGTNEAGKTSLLEFVRGVFFGFGPLFDRGVLDPRVSTSGRLVVRDHDQSWTLEREHDTIHSHEFLSGLVRGRGRESAGEHLRITDARGTMHVVDESGGDAPGPFDGWTAGIDWKTYTSVMAFGLDELHELSSLDAEGCGARLYELAGGLDRAKVARVLGDIADALARLDDSSPETSPIAALERQLASAKNRLAALHSPAIAAGDAWTEAVRLEAEIESLARAVTRAERFERLVLEAIDVEPLHAANHRTAERLAGFGNEPLVHPDLEVWRELVRLRDQAARIAEKRRRIRGRASARYKAVSAPSAAWSKRTSIMALADDLPRLDRLLSEAAQSDAHSRLASRRFGELLGTAGIARLWRVEPKAVAADVAPWEAADPFGDTSLPIGFTRPFGGLRAKSRAVAAARREVVQATAAVREAKTGLDGLRSSLVGAGKVKLAEAIEEASAKATLYRNRITAGDQLAELDRATQRLEREVVLAARQQLVPVEWLLGLGAVFVLGAGLLLSGLLLPQAVPGSMAYAMAALGLAGVVVAGATTWSLDRAATGRLDVSRRQLELARKQRQEAQAACEQLERRIPSEAMRALAQRAAEAQAEVERLEGIAAREGTLHLLSDGVSTAEDRLAKAIAATKAAKASWRRALEQRGLPPTLRPSEVRELARHRTALLALDDERRRAAEEARVRRESVAAYRQRIEQLLADCDMLPGGSLNDGFSATDQVRRLRERLESDSTHARLRRRRKRKLVAARRLHRRALRSLHAAESKLSTLFTRWGVADEASFVALVDRRQEFERLREEARVAAAEFTAARDRLAANDDLPESRLEDLDRWLAESLRAADAATISLSERAREADRAVAQARDAVARARERRAAALARAEASAQDRSGEPLQREIADVEERLTAQQQRRRSLSLARDLLEETRLQVARDHQPPVLKEASRWLARLTGGRYVAITTLLDEALLEIHDSDGRHWKPDRLSRGTREQVFLALRLALVSDLERRGVRMPVIMDDALVNFDDARAASAARVLVEFAEESPRFPRQLLVLTCHAHVARLFDQAGATVRSLDGTLRRWLPEKNPAPEPVREIAPEPVTVTFHEPAHEPATWPEPESVVIHSPPKKSRVVVAMRRHRR